MVAGSNPALDAKVVHDTNSELSTLTPVHPTMLCSIDYTRSSVKPFAKDATKFYLDLVFVPKNMSNPLLMQAVTQAEIRMQFFPRRDRNNNIDIQHMQALVTAFNAKQFTDMYVEKFKVKIKPCYFTYTADQPSVGIVKGTIVIDQTTRQPIVYDEVSITSLSQIDPATGKEVPAIPMAQLERQAARLREQRIKDGSWREITVPTQPSLTLAAQQAAEALASASASDVLPY